MSTMPITVVRLVDNAVTASAATVPAVAASTSSATVDHCGRAMLMSYFIDHETNTVVGPYKYLIVQVR